MPGQRGWPGPPWHGAGGDPKFAPRAASWHRKRRFLFGRFLVAFGFVTFFVAGGMAILALLITRVFGGDGQTALLVWVAGCGLALALPAVAVVTGLHIYRNMATPLADVMAAADAVADGDLSVRVHERGSGEFAKLAASFNRMAEELERNDQRRRNLTADVAHELRTPLHIIQGNLEGVLDHVYQPTPDHIEATLDETRALARLVEDLRTISLAEGGQLALHMEPVRIDELLADLRTGFGPRAEQDGIQLVSHIDGDPDSLTVLGDPGRLDQVLTNLVANALRHTPAAGQVSLQASRADERVIVTVADTGEGIPADDLPFIFDRFWRGDRARANSDGAGGGLGLAIARQLVQAHGGTIDVQSEVGTGTTFTIELPATETRSAS